MKLTTTEAGKLYGIKRQLVEHRIKHGHYKLAWINKKIKGIEIPDEEYKELCQGK